MLQSKEMVGLVNGVFGEIFQQIAAAYQENINGIVREYMNCADREFISAHYPEMEDILPLYSLYAILENASEKLEAKMLIVVTKEIRDGKRAIIFYINPIFDGDQKVRELLSETIEKIKKYALGTSIVLSKLKEM